MPVNPDSLLGKQLGNYVLLELQGRGGLGRVYFARHRLLGTHVAVKVIGAELQHDPDHAQRFKREARSVFRLKHPHIVDFYEFGVVEDLYYLAVEHVDGADLGWALQDYARNGELIALEDAVRIVEQMASALDYVHAQGVIHRDIKPSNILLDRQARAVLTDFGMARVMSERTEATSFGSAQYIAPEQAISSAKAVAQSDFYSLGVVLYRMLTGTLPFEADTPMSLALKHISEPPPAPRSVNPDLHPALEQVVLRALSKEVEKRFQTGAALVKAFHGALDEASAAQRAARAGAPAAPPAGPGHPSARTAHPDQALRISSRSLQQVVGIKQADRKTLATREPSRTRELASSLLRFRATPVLGPAFWVGVLCAVLVVAWVRGAALLARPEQPLPAAHVVQSATRLPAESGPTVTIALLAAPATDTAPLTAPPTAPPEAQPIAATDAPTIATETPAPPAPAATQTQSPTPAPPANAQMIYNDAAVTVINISAASISLAGVTFQGVSDEGAVTASFSASSWSRYTYHPITALPAGHCFQVRRYGASSSKPPACDRLQGWIVTGDRAQHFWRGGSGSSAFRIVQNNSIINTCRVADGRCAFYLPQW